MRVCVFMCICVYACLCVYVYMSVCLCVFVYMRVCVYMCMCVWCIFMCLCVMCLYIYCPASCLLVSLSLSLCVSLPVCKSVWVYSQIDLNVCARCECVMVVGGTWMSHDTHTNESWHTWVKYMCHRSSSKAAA